MPSAVPPFQRQYVEWPIQIEHYKKRMFYFRVWFDRWYSNVLGQIEWCFCSGSSLIRVGVTFVSKNGQIKSIESIDSELRKTNIMSSTLTNKSKAAIFLASLTTMVWLPQYRLSSIISHLMDSFEATSNVNKNIKSNVHENVSNG